DRGRQGRGAEGFARRHAGGTERAGRRGRLHRVEPPRLLARRRALHARARVALGFGTRLAGLNVVRLRVMTYNIQGHAAERQQDHMIKIAETVAGEKPDVVALQEVYCRKSGDQGAIVAHLAGLKLAFGKSCEINGGDYGNAILTRGTIESSRVHPLPGAGEPRSLLETCVAVDG